MCDVPSGGARGAASWMTGVRGCALLVAIAGGAALCGATAGVSSSPPGQLLEPPLRRLQMAECGLPAAPSEQQCSAYARLPASL